MPFEFDLNSSPYRSSYFRVLKIGPHASRPQIIQRAKDLCKKLSFQEKPQLDGVPVEEHQINEAAAKLGDPTICLEEMLLTHAPAKKNLKRLNTLIGKLDELANFPVEQLSLALAHPLAALWFLPAPKPDAAALPNWEEFRLGQAGDKGDDALDVVFDR